MIPRSARMAFAAVFSLAYVFLFSGVQLTFAQGADPLIIAEFRTRGPNGKFDEFIKIYNNSDSPVTVQASDASAGWSVGALSGSTNSLSLTHRCTIPNGTVIPARGNFLCAIALTGGSDQGYSLGTYAQPDVVYGTDIDDNRGIALFTTDNQNNYTALTRVDSASFNTSNQAAAILAREGTALPSAGNANGEYSWVRRAHPSTGRPVDTNDNATDFKFISTTAGTFSGTPSELGMPGPQNLGDPNERNATIIGSLVPDPMSPSGFRQNVRDLLDTGTNKTFGTLTIFRRFTNEGTETLNKLRFRVFQITTVNSPLVCDTRCPQSDIRYLDSGIVPSGSPKATLLDAQVTQPMGGGINTSANVGGVIDLGANPLAPGDSVDVQFVLGIETRGYFQFFVNIEGQGAPSSAPVTEGDEIAPQPQPILSSPLSTTSTKRK